MTHFVAYAYDELFEEHDSIESAQLNCDQHVRAMGGDARQTFVLEIGSDDLVHNAWVHIDEGTLEETTDYIGEDVDSL